MLVDQPEGEHLARGDVRRAARGPAARGDEPRPIGSSVTLAAGLLLCGATLVVRSFLLERRMRLLLSRERAALSNLAQRESELARLNERLAEDSRRDALTGMRNRWALADDLPRLEAVREERGESFAIVLCDIDHFKAYNDRFGHLAGDQALRAISATVRGALRAGSIAYRFGGEELLLVLPDTAAGQALAVAERVRAAVQDAAIPHVDGVGGVLTVSIGVAAGPDDSAKLLARADAALYQAKDAGRNLVIVAAESDGLSEAGNNRGMRALVLKSHWEPTASMAYLVRKAVPGIEIFGGIDLNRSVGGVNPTAVERMASIKGGWGRVVWMPTFDSENQVRYSKENRLFVGSRRAGNCCPK